MTNLVNQEPKNEAAWLWLSACLDRNEQKLYCIRKVLDINPDNQHAKAAFQKFTSPALPDVEQILTKPRETQKQTQTNLPLPQLGHQTKEKKKRNKFVTFLAALGLVVLLFACFSSVFNDDTPTQQTTNPQSAPQEPVKDEGLVVKAGTLSQYDGQISRNTVVNVYKTDGTLDGREDDLKELCLDWLFYRAMIMKYESEGKSDKADEARADFNQINRWLDEYNEDDVQTMFSIIEKNNWSNW